MAKKYIALHKGNESGPSKSPGEEDFDTHRAATLSKSMGLINQVFVRRMVFPPGRSGWAVT